MSTIAVPLLELPDDSSGTFTARVQRLENAEGASNILRGCGRAPELSCKFVQEGSFRCQYRRRLR